MVAGLFVKLYAAAEAANRRNIKQLLQDGPYNAICDLGCDDGEWTAEIGRVAGSRQSFGIEIVRERARLAQSRGVHVAIADLSAAFPFEDQSFDLVHANQVIEHVSDIDHFLAEANRVLRFGGTAVISTENGSSWHNIFAAVMGWQIFSLTNVSGLETGIGNPLALHRGDRQALQSWRHRTIFNYRGLIEVLGVHGLTAIRVMGAGYHPLPAALGRIDRRHSHFITVKAVKQGPSRLSEAAISRPESSRHQTTSDSAASKNLSTHSL